jgi:hypothetical protein
MFWVLAAVAGIYVLSMLYILYEVGQADIEYEEREMKYLGKPVEIDAMQWHGTTTQREFFEWMEAHSDNEDDWMDRKTELFIQTAHNGQWVSVQPGDYVVREQQRGRFYPVKQDIFEARYTLIPEAT